MLKRIVLSVCAAVAAAVGAQAETYTWNAGTTGNWEDAANWTVKGGTPERAPSSQDDVILPAPTDAANSYVVTADAAINVKSLTVGTDDAADGCTATFESQTAEMHQVAGNVVVKKGGVLTHTTAAAKALYKLYLRCGNMTVDAYGAINVNNKGGTVISG